MIRALAIAAALAFGVAASTVSGRAAAPQAQANFTATELDYAEGSALYRNRCLRCHGPDGVALEGTDIAALSTTLSDDDLLPVIIGGIPETAMSPTGLTAFEAGTVAAYLRFVAIDRVTEAQGDAARGQALIEGRGGCLDCHTIEGTGGLVAPDLSDIGSRRRSGELRDSLLDPNAEVRTENRFVDARLTGGTTLRGRLLNQDSFSIQILSMDERLTAISKADLEELEFIDSPMPSFRDRLSPQELNDIVRYLMTLR